MAVFVLMIKVEENREKVIYKFGPDRKCMGIIEYNRNKKSSVFNAFIGEV